MAENTLHRFSSHHAMTVAVNIIPLMIVGRRRRRRGFWPSILVLGPRYSYVSRTEEHLKLKVNPLSGVCRALASTKMIINRYDHLTWESAITEQSVKIMSK